MRAWVESLQARERLILVGGVAAAALILLWFGAMKLHTQTELLRDSIGAKQRLLVELSRVGIQPAGPAPGTIGQGQTLVVLINASAKEHGIALTRSREDGPNGVQISFANLPFDMLADWLVMLETQSSITVDSASFTSAKQKGVVNGQILLHRS
jgi:type II secretory pathway component PulM